jgi:hypothetical protein
MGAQISAHSDPAASRAFSRDHVRLRIRQLDACLERLEGAHERGAVTVPDALAMVVGRYVPGLRSGMTITHAIELVMREQEPHLAYSGAPRPDHRREPAAPAQPDSQPFDDGRDMAIDENGARELTERIRAAAHTAHRLCSLLVEAHERRAWLALGYPTWAEYVGAEFRLSRSRSYELLDHGRVLRALEAATGLSGIPDISAYAAAQIRPHLDEVTQAIRARCAGLSRPEIARAAEQVVREIRSRHVTERNDRRALEAQRGHDLLSRLYDAVHTLTQMPDVSETLRIIPPGHAHHLDGLYLASSWLTELARAWPSRQETTGILEAGA